MRFTVTALGSAGGRTVGQVVADLVRYLEPRVPEAAGPAPGTPPVPSGDGPASYYADRGSEAGRWLGYSAGEAGLVGAVDPQDFARVLAGRDPHTGARLLTATGSAGRRPTLGAGQATRTGPDGQPLYDTADIAAALHITRREAEALLDAGERRSPAGPAGEGTTRGTEPEGSYLIPLVDDDGERWVTGSELDRCEDARALGTEPEAVAAGGTPTDQLSLVEAARLAGVTAQYLRGLCRRWETHRDRITNELAEGKVPKRAYVVAHRGTKRQWIIKRGELVAFLQRRTAPAVRVGYDLTLTTEKSLGVLAGLGGEDMRRAVLDAIQAGNDAGMAFLEYHASAGRSRGKEVLARGLTIASFRHLTSRALDPFPHHHNVVANAIIDEHGSRRALDARGLYLNAQAASALATAKMRHQLTATLGVRWRRRPSGSWEIAGISEEVLREFSRRRNEIEDALAELEAAIGRRSSLDEVQATVTGTRRPKEHVDPADLVAGWWERARHHGLSPRRLAKCTGGGAVTAEVDEGHLFAMLASPTSGVCAGQSLFTRSDVLVALVDLDYDDGPLLVAPEEVERLADAFLTSPHVVALDTSGESGALGRAQVFTTTEILGLQHRIAARFEQGAAAGMAIVPAAIIEDTLAAHPHLTGEQRHLVSAFCSSGRGVQCAIGRAGAGKTTTMRAAAEAWREAGYEVLGAAVQGEAARQLSAGAGISTETVAWYLARADRPPLHERSVLLVDEASTLSDRDLDALLHLAGRAGAAVRLIGDPDQHGAVAAGGMFRYLCMAGGEATPELATAHRVRDPADREAARLLREGHTADALTQLADAGHLHLVNNDLDLYLGMLSHWWDAHDGASPHPMVDRRHATRHVLNRLARQMRSAHGELGTEEVVASGERRFAVGDRVVARMASRDLHVAGRPEAYVRNGASGTVVAVDAAPHRDRDRVSVRFDDVGVIDLPRSFFDEHRNRHGRVDVGIDYAYAVTSHGVQGATFDESTSRIDEGATRSEAYVDITRGRQGNHLYLTRAATWLDGERLPEAPPPKIDDSVADRLRRSGPERVAVEFQPKVGPPPLDPAVAVAWDERFPRPIDGPVHLRHRWAATKAAALANRIDRQPTPCDAEWSCALSAPAPNDRAQEERDRAVKLMNAYTAAVTAECALRTPVPTEGLPTDVVVAPAGRPEAIDVRRDAPDRQRGSRRR
ncbi:MAG TPA: MobF family relaxase [Acidimicrobiales bacterium]|nr:MobF family relaxase [Acidimicrobiales bacterium]